MIHERSAAVWKPQYVLRLGLLRLLGETLPRLGGRNDSFLGLARATLRLATNHWNHLGQQMGKNTREVKILRVQAMRRMS